MKYPDEWKIIDSPPNYLSLALESSEKERLNIFDQANNKKLPIEQWYKEAFPRGGNYTITTAG